MRRNFNRRWFVSDILDFVEIEILTCHSVSLEKGSGNPRKFNLKKLFIA